MFELHRGNALTVLRSMEDESVDMAAFDPPYPTISGGSNEKGGGDWSRPSGILAKNDGKIFEHNDIRPEVYLPELHRVLKPQAHVYMMTNLLGLVNGILPTVMQAGFQIHNLLVWKKNTATPNRWYMKDIEYTIFARKGKAKAINNKGDKTSQIVQQHVRDLLDTWADGMEFPYACDHKNPRGDDRQHPTAKPVALMQTYIENSSEPGDVVLDMFMGAGSTGVAAEESGRGFVGIEIDEEYFQKAAGRMPSADVVVWDDHEESDFENDHEDLI